MTNYRDSQGNDVPLNKKIASSGEGEVWTTNLSGYLAKIYHSPTTERGEKLKVMIANPPDNPTASQNHISIAWQTDLLYDINGRCVGFLMPEIKKSKQLLDVYNPKLRKIHAPHFNWYCLHLTALNLASIIHAVHQRNYVIGDMKTQNILVTELGFVSIIDTDSFQVKDPKNGIVYRCSVGSEGFTPPELINKDLKNLTQTRFNDRFRLAIIIHHLLFGYHPFRGEWKGSGDPPGQDESVSKNFWPYGQNNQMQLNQNGIPLDILHPEINELFLKCFNDGHKSPSSRPSPQDWFNALQLAIADLESCSKIPNHSYSRTFGRCYWCERANASGLDIFPSVTNAIQPPKPKPKPVRPAPKPQPQPQAVPLPPVLQPQRVPVAPPRNEVYWSWLIAAVIFISSAITITGLAWENNLFGLKEKICKATENNGIEKSFSSCLLEKLFKN